MKLIGLTLILMSTACATFEAKFPDGRSIEGTTLGQSELSVDAEGVLNASGGSISEVFGGFLDGILNALPFGRGTQPDINITVPPAPSSTETLLDV